MPDVLNAAHPAVSVRATGLHETDPARTDALDDVLRRARPRLLRLARALGVPGDATDDIVQETLFAAWRQLDHLRSPDRFDAWLDAICRNHVRMYLRGRHAAAGRPDAPQARAETILDADLAARDAGDVADPLAVDPLEEVSRHDLAVLLDRALGYLPASARTALELRYLTERSEREVAEALGLSVRVLEARLHRARRHLRDVLEGPLRAEAEAFGLTMDRTPLMGWQETRIWCTLCGRHRLRGVFEPLSHGGVELRLRCPTCSERYGVDIYRSKDVVALDGLRSFRPALTRTLRALAGRTSQSLASGHDVCLHCGRPVRRRVVAPDELPPPLPQGLQQHWVVAACSHADCSGLGPWTAVEPAIWFHPAAQRFMAEHPRWITTPEEVVQWANQLAIRFRLVDVAGAAQLVVLAERETLRILATFAE